MKFGGDKLSGLTKWLLDHLAWVILPILGYFVINFVLWGGKKGIKRVFWRTGEEKRSKLDIHNILILILIIMLVLVLWRL